MKKMIPLLASMLLLAACTNSPSTPSKTASTQENSETTTVVTSQSQVALTFLEEGEIYVDFNFDAAPVGLSIKIGDSTLTSSGKAKMTQNFEYAVNGTFDKPMNVYRVVDTDGAVSAAKSEGYDANGVKTYLERNLANFAEKQYGYRIYLCLSDKASGWSKTLPGVDESIKKYAPTV